MALNMLRLLPTDDQQTFMDKANFNFDQLYSLNGGDIGLQGLTGIQGVPGGQGIQGLIGADGLPGSHLYVENTDPTSFGTLSPEPNAGDVWFDTVGLGVYTYDGAAWNLSGTLEVSSVFKALAADPEKLAFGSPTANMSLTLSPVDYDAGGTIQAGTYKLKIIGTSGAAMLNLGVLESGEENAAANQAYALINTITPSSEYSLEVVNPTGDIGFTGFGSSLFLKKNDGTITALELNGTALKLQVAAATRAIGFFDTPASLSFHVGSHTAITDTAERILSVFDDGRVAVGDVEGNPITGDAGSPKLELRGDDLGLVAADVVRWARLRGKAQTSNVDSLDVRHHRIAAGVSGASEIRLEHRVNDAAKQFVSFGGAASTIKFGYLDNTGVYMGMASNGRVMMGSATYLSTALANSLPSSRLTVQTINAGAVEGNLSFSGMHLVTAGSSGVVGITAGNNSIAPRTLGQLSFEYTSDLFGAVSTHIGGGYGADGVRKMQTLKYTGEIFFWSHTDTDNFLRIEPGVRWNTAQAYENDMFYVNAYHQGTGTQKSIVFQDTSDTTGYGDGFFGIGEGFSEDIGAGIGVLTSGKWYKSMLGTASSAGTWPEGTIFLGNDPSLGIGVVKLAKPVTKFHVWGAVTFGSRASITTYSSEVGANSFTHGRNNKAAALNSSILSGRDHVISATSSYTSIIGYNGNNGYTMSEANRVLLAAKTILTARPGASLTIDSGLQELDDLSISSHMLKVIQPANVGGIQIHRVEGETGWPLTVTYDNGGSILPDLAFTDNHMLMIGATYYSGLTTDTGVTASNRWSVAEPRLLIGDNADSNRNSNLVFVASDPETSAATFQKGVYITTTSRSIFSSAQIYGKSMFLHPGETRNNTNGQPATGSTLFIRGGYATLNLFGSAVESTSGNVHMAYDPKDDKTIGGVIVGKSGTWVNGLIVAKVEVEKTSNTTANLTLVGGGNHTVTLVAGSSSDSVTFDLTFEAAFPNSLIFCVAGIDSTDTTHSDWNIICVGRDVDKATFKVTKNTNWTALFGTIGVSIIIHCVRF